MSKADEVREKIIQTFSEELDKHIFSKKGYPKEVTIKTVYAECIQTLTINFDK